MTVFKRKRVLTLLLVALLLLLFYSPGLLAKLLYPVYYTEQIRHLSETYQVDPFLIAAIIRAESKYHPERISSKGAVGLMQLMPETAAWIIEQGRLPFTMDNLHEPDANMELGTWYLRLLSHQFAGQEAAVIAAYNAGPGNVARWLESGQWDGTLESYGKIPFGETRHYVRKVEYYAKKYKAHYTEQFVVRSRST